MAKAGAPRNYLNAETYSDVSDEEVEWLVKQIDWRKIEGLFEFSIEDELRSDLCRPIIRYVDVIKNKPYWQPVSELEKPYRDAIKAINTLTKSPDPVWDMLESKLIAHNPYNERRGYTVRQLYPMIIMLSESLPEEITEEGFEITKISDAEPRKSFIFQFVRRLLKRKKSIPKSRNWPPSRASRGIQAVYLEIHRIYGIEPPHGDLDPENCRDDNVDCNGNPPPGWTTLQYEIAKQVRRCECMQPEWSV